MNSKKLWDSMKTATNMKSTEKSLHVTDELAKANELNYFYKRFDNNDFSAECNMMLDSMVIDDADRLKIDLKSINKVFKQVNVTKATGPDGISPFLLRTCADELTSAWCPIFQRSLYSHIVPALWKKAIITPVPKKSCPQENNDFRPIALTSVVMKCMEKLIMSQLIKEVGSQLDPYQFAYKHQRGTDDAINSLVHLVTKHLENPMVYARLLFVDFSSAFNTLQPHILLKTMQRMNVNPSIIKWLHSFLTNRSQQVRVNKTLSESTTISTGVPQGCVSSPVLFTLYTNQCTCSTGNNYMIKFSDDTAILGLISGTSDVAIYKDEVQNFVQWCDTHFLSINTKKTVEIIFDPKSIGDHLPLVISGQNIGQVDSYKYLGIHIDNKLTWSAQVENVCIRVQQRLYFLRRLRVFGVNQKVLLLFYHTVIESILRYGISAWFGNLSVHLKAKITRLMQRAMKIVGVKQHPALQALF
ncbi:RNA-directed DNA polymerase from mobile element jockey [Labeo rohita]|uniref:RNA-directed DNA polymerase from mobile element jockey n=1 Tax=Labeo rohita TaxID=84645 RepID=A0ABQ8L2R2_LABRO|nr:RNA-directed DNA polymerase from mobile element jockey [Labeo rohita]